MRYTYALHNSETSISTAVHFLYLVLIVEFVHFDVLKLDLHAN